MNIKIVANIIDMINHFKFTLLPYVAEEDLDIVETECDLYERKRRDAEALCTVVANCNGNCLDIGTSHGRSAFKIATNLNDGIVYTVNALPEQITSEESFVTHLLTKEEIGSYYRSYGIKNVNQIYANTLNWDIPEYISNLSMAFIDGNHDTFAVYSDTKLAYNRLKEGGFILWHDFNPELRSKYEWIDAAMSGVEKFLVEYGIKAEIVHLQNSWIGILQKITLQTSNNGVSNYVSIGNQPRVLLGYSDYPYPTSVSVANEAWLERLRREGFAVDGYCLTLSPPSSCIFWPDLDRKWKERDPLLLAMYEDLFQKLCNGSYDIFVNYNGINLHPDFIQQLRKVCFCVYVCFDDPESSNILSRPVAAAYDLAMPGNIAELDSYRNWGCRNVAWLPLGFRADEYDPDLTAQDILQRQRKVDIAIVCERESPWRRDRLDHLQREFPTGFYFGKGWASGFINEAHKIPLYQETRIGFNLHNSTGPINYRTFTIPANGAMLLCDNSSYLGKIFEIGREAVGYDYMDEAVFKARFYLQHEEMRREIALAGWRRVLRDYNETACFRRILEEVNRVQEKERNLQPLKGSNESLLPFNAMGLKWYLDPQRYIDRFIMDNRIFEKNTTCQMAEIVRPGMKWIDVGANIGYYTLLLSQWSAGAGHGYAFEPTPILKERLINHVVANDFTDRVTIFEFGLSDKAQYLEIGYDTISSTLHWPNVESPQNTATIELRRLDDVTEIVDGPRIDILKIDIDGHEPFFFRGAHHFFSLHRPIIAMEFANLSLFSAGESVFSLLQELKAIEYTVYSETTGLPFKDSFTFLIECGNYATSANAWALPNEITPLVPEISALKSLLPRTASAKLEVFSSITDMLLAEHVTSGNTGTVSLASLGNKKIQVRGGTTDSTVLWDAFHYKYHLPPIPLCDNCTIIDLGCNVGYTTAHMAQLFSMARLISVELDAGNHKQALINTAAFSNRCTIVHGAIWHVDGEVGYSGVSEQGFHVDPDCGDRKVKAIAIDTLMSNYEVSWVDYMKMDIEGAEREIMTGDTAWLERVGSIKIEIHRMEDYDPIRLHLEKNGFVCSIERQHYCCIEAIKTVKPYIVTGQL